MGWTGLAALLVSAGAAVLAYQAGRLATARVLGLPVVAVRMRLPLPVGIRAQIGTTLVYVERATLPALVVHIVTGRSEGGEAGISPRLPPSLRSVDGGALAEGFPGRRFEDSPTANALTLALGGLVAAVSLPLLCLAVVAGYVSLPRERYSSAPVVGLMLPEASLANGGLRPGDTVLAIDGEPVANFHEVAVAIITKPPGERRILARTASGEERTYPFTPAVLERPASLPDGRRVYTYVGFRPSSEQYYPSVSSILPLTSYFELMRDPRGTDGDVERGS